MRKLVQKEVGAVLLLAARLFAYQFRLYVRLSGGLLYLVGWVYLIYIIVNLSADTTPITNTAFAMVASLAALSFSACRAVTEPADHQDRLRYAGERFFHAAILLLFASLLKYAAFRLWSGGQAATPIGYVIVIDVAGFLAAYSFGTALYASHAGLMELNNVLWLRYERQAQGGRVPFYALVWPPSKGLQLPADAPSREGSRPDGDARGGGS